MALTDLTRISTSGIATGSTIDAPILRKDVSFRGSQVGVNSAIFDSSDDALEFNDNVQLKFGNSGDLSIYHTGNNSIIRDQGTGSLSLQSNGTEIALYNSSNDKYMGKFANNAQVELYHAGNLKITTDQAGAKVTGVLTATSFSGTIIGSPINNPSGISTFYDLRVTNNLTVEGTTTTLDTNLIGVDRVEVGANSNTVTGIAVTQSGTADIVRLYDGSTQVVTVDDVGNVGIGSAIPSQKLDVLGTLTYDGTYLDIGGGVTRFTKQGSYNSLEIGYGQNSNQNAFIDLIGDTTYTDYGTRIIRYGQNGANGTTDILHRGTGSLNLQTSDAASIVFKTNGNNERFRIAADGTSSFYSPAEAWHEGPAVLEASNGYGAIFFRSTGSTHGTSVTGTWSIGKLAGTDGFAVLKNGMTGGSGIRQDAPINISNAGDTRIGFNLGIGVAPASGHLLHIKNSGTAEAKVKIESESGYDARLILDTSNGGGAGGHIDFQIDGTAKGGIQYVTNGSASDQHDIIFRNNDYSEKLRINANGDVTTTGQASFDRQNAGFTARAGDAVSITRASGTPLEINRTGSDGQMISLLDDNTQEAAISISGGSLQFGTPNSNSARLTITSTGLVGINENSPGTHLHVNSSTYNGVATFESTDAYAHLIIKDNSTHATGTYFGVQGNDFRWITHDGSNSAERVRVTETGVLLVGHTSSPTSDADKIQAISTSSGTGICLHNYSASNYGNQIAFMKSRSNTIGGNTLLNSGDRIGELNFYGNDGSGRSLGAQIQVMADGTQSNDNSPSRINLRTGTNQTMSTRLAIHPAGTVGVSKGGYANSDHSMSLTVNTGTDLTDGLMIVSNYNGGNQNSDTGKIMFCGHGQTNGVYMYKDNEVSYGKGALVFHTHSTSNSYSTQLAETARFTAYGRFGLGTGGPGQTTVDSLMHIQGNSDDGDESCQLTIEDEDTTSGSQIPSIQFKGNGANTVRVRGSDTNGLQVATWNGSSQITRMIVGKNTEGGGALLYADDRGWATFRHNEGQGLRTHIRQRYSPGNAVQTHTIMRIRRNNWGWGTFKITLRSLYYYGTNESVWHVNGHGVNGDYYSVSKNTYGGDASNHDWNAITLSETASSSSPGTSGVWMTDVKVNIPNYTYVIIIVEAYSSTYSTDPNTMNDNCYCMM